MGTCADQGRVKVEGSSAAAVFGVVGGMLPLVLAGLGGLLPRFRRHRRNPAIGRIGNERGAPAGDDPCAAIAPANEAMCSFGEIFVP